MRSNQHVFGTLALVLAVGGGLTACGPTDDKAGGAAPAASASASSDPSASTSAQPSKDPKDAKPSKGAQASKGTGTGGAGDDLDDHDCGAPPKLPAGQKIIQVGLHRDISAIEAFDAQPKCTPNDWIYHGEGDPKSYKLPADVKAELAVGPGQHKKVTREELSMHIDACLREDYSRVKQPFSCYGNIYEVTLNAKGEIATMRERWSV
ncbi:hypothetical protein [Streptomyces sp. NPDC089799]|uniref:hypothetical protein n=1 Tax=Streptomyces sp. NPDC089799 TaxID=3155066 RepID=UPI00343D33EE